MKEKDKKQETPFVYSEKFGQPRKIFKSFSDFKKYWRELQNV